MDAGIIFTILGLIFYSILGFLYKMTVYKNCSIRNTLFIAFFCSMILSIFTYLFLRDNFINISAILIGIIGGIFLYIAIYNYIKSLTIGKKVTSWIIFKMSLVIAVIFSIFLWEEKPSLNQIIGFFLMLLAIIFLGIDMKIRGKENSVD